MTTVKILLDDLDKIKTFNRIVGRFSSDFDLEQGRYYIDAKSMLGILSLDLHAPLQLHFSATEEEEKEILDSIKEYLI